MRKPVLGIVVGAVLGFIDGLSAWFSPDARSMMIAIVIGSTGKGIITGLLAGFVARTWSSTTIGVASGMAIGAVLSAIATVGQGGHYLEIILPGMLLGAVVGFATQRYPRTSEVRRAMIAALALLLGSTAVAQEKPAIDRFAAVAPLVGKWSGTSEGQPGNGTVAREYERVLGSRFIRVRNTSTYPPQAKNPKGERHEDEGFISFDGARKRLVFRQFHIEGFVNTYVQDLEAKSGAVAFVSEAIENIPSGYRARETYIFSGPDEVEEVFELAEPGKEFTIYSRTKLKRVR